MSGDEQEGEGFKIRDRRRFDAEGNVRDDGEEDVVGTNADASSVGTEHSTKGEPIPQIDFSTFIFSLSTSAMVHLGEAPTPDGTVETNLELARQTIDMLAMLQQKTQGNLSEDEAHLLGQLLYDLRVRYVQATR